MISPPLFAGFPVGFRDIAPYLIVIFIALLGASWLAYYLMKEPRKRGEILLITGLLLVCGGMAVIGALLIYFLLSGRVFFWQW